jgi:four helix bundle protein
MIPEMGAHMTKVNNFVDLDSWKRAYGLALECYRLVKKLPSEERQALSLQIRRSAISIHANIAEGFGRGTPPDYARHLFIARGSLHETRGHIMFARDAGLVTATDVTVALDQCDHAGRTLNWLISRVTNNARPKAKTVNR